MGKGRDKRKKCKTAPAGSRKPKEEDGSDQDIDALLEECVQEAVERNKVHVTEDGTGPSTRANAAAVLNPLNSQELFIFGGEYCDGERSVYYSDLYKYNVESNTWKRVSSAPAPKPRSSHQLVVCSTGKLLMFGGEFGTPNDSKFLHHRDCWLLDPKTCRWEEVAGATPSPRSGHRMVSWRNLVVMFGGFHDDGRNTRYLDDLWIFDCRTSSWSKVAAKGERPPPRSGFVFAACDEGAVLYSGYQVAKDAKGPASGKCLDDFWVLHLPTTTDAAPFWVRCRPSNGPSVRSGCCACVVKNRLYIFGGVVDSESDDEYLYGVCQNQLYYLDLVRKQTWNRVAVEGAAPHGRFNSMMVPRGSELFIFGGIVEVGDADVFLDDIWRFHVGSNLFHKVRGLSAPIESSILRAECDCDGTSDSDRLDDSDGTSGSNDSDDSNESAEDSDADTLCDNDGGESQSFSQYPRPNAKEALRDYYQRTQDVFVDLVRSQGVVEDKQCRKEAFRLAETAFRGFQKR